ncbi:hypothetical protein [Pseudomonas bohemica]|uniref:hypothetical protein n=1 Tax=Pseudomonas bohemica TaxID=2044872 RepID=UPI000DA60279|nr:hypothetical protein [Pseudomonas bohemica]
MGYALRNYDDWKTTPPVVDDSHERAIEEWVTDSIEQLIQGNDVKFKRRMHAAQAVTQADFRRAVDMHVNNRLADHVVQCDALGEAVLLGLAGAPTKSVAEVLIGYSDHPYGMRGVIAESLLRPFAKDALIAQAEDDEL